MIFPLWCFSPDIQVERKEGVREKGKDDNRREENRLWFYLEGLKRRSDQQATGNSVCACQIIKERGSEGVYMYV